MAKVDVGALHKDAFARPGEIIFRRACTFPFHHRKSVAILHAPWRAHAVQLLRFGLLALLKFGLCAARISDNCLKMCYFCRAVRVSNVLTWQFSRKLVYGSERLQRF